MYAPAIGAPADATPETVAVVFDPSPPLLAQPVNGLDEFDDALQAVRVTELVATLLLPSVMVMVAT